MAKKQEGINLDTGFLKHEEVTAIATGLVGSNKAEFEPTMRKLIALNKQAQADGNINRQGDKGQTLLHFAVQAGAADVVGELLNTHNANPNWKNNEQQTPLDLAHNNKDKKNGEQIAGVLEAKGGQTATALANLAKIKAEAKAAGKENEKLVKFANKAVEKAVGSQGALDAELAAMGAEIKVAKPVIPKSPQVAQKANPDTTPPPSLAEATAAAALEQKVSPVARTPAPAAAAPPPPPEQQQEAPEVAFSSSARSVIPPSPKAVAPKAVAPKPSSPAIPSPPSAVAPKRPLMTKEDVKAVLKGLKTPQERGEFRNLNLDIAKGTKGIDAKHPTSGKNLFQYATDAGNQDVAQKIQAGIAADAKAKGGNQPLDLPPPVAMNNAQQEVGATSPSPDLIMPTLPPIPDLGLPPAAVAHNPEVGGSSSASYSSPSSAYMVDPPEGEAAAPRVAGSPTPNTSSSSSASYAPSSSSSASQGVEAESGPPPSWSSIPTGAGVPPPSPSSMPQSPSPSSSASMSSSSSSMAPRADEEGLGPLPSWSSLPARGAGAVAGAAQSPLPSSSSSASMSASSASSSQAPIEPPPGAAQSPTPLDPEEEARKRVGGQPAVAPKQPLQVSPPPPEMNLDNAPMFKAFNEAHKAAGGKFPVVGDPAKEFKGNILGEIDLGNGQKGIVISFDNPKDAQAFMAECEKNKIPIQTTDKLPPEKQREVQGMVNNLADAKAQKPPFAPARMAEQYPNPPSAPRGSLSPSSSPSSGKGPQGPAQQGNGAPAGGR